MSKQREHRDGARVALSRLRVDIPNEPEELEPVLASGSVVTGNISTGGVGFILSQAHAALRVGDRVTVRFRLPDAFDDLLVRAEVRHVAPRMEGGLRVGARFLDADPIVENPLFRYIEESLLAIRATSESFIDSAVVAP